MAFLLLHNYTDFIGRKAFFDFLANLRIIEKMVHLNLDYCKYKIRGARYGKQKEETTI
ncbi:hypothetical protein Q97_01440 [Enterococcus faecalis EnGen0061]|nr:hypothetical protein Q97_01440 [Enterococcus faecalis EnGen0061]